MLFQYIILKRQQTRSRIRLLLVSITAAMIALAETLAQPLCFGSMRGVTKQATGGIPPGHHGTEVNWPGIMVLIQYRADN